MSQSKSQYVAIGLMLFALFFGAGNLIFPVSMGQAAGENVWWAVLGFCLTGVGMPLICVVAMGYSGCRDLQEERPKNLLCLYLRCLHRVRLRRKNGC